MRILIVLPRQERATGNEVTAARHHDGLVALGHEVLLERVDLADGLRLRACVETFAPDVVHLLHAYRSGRPWLEANLSAIPYVVTLTGTDINDGIDSPAQGPIIRRLLAAAGKIITQNRLTATPLRREYPALADKVTWLPPGIVLGTAPSLWSRAELAPPDVTLLLHPAGLRPVKGNLELLALCDPLATAALPFSLAFCGPVLDSAYSADFCTALARRPWARYLGVIPPEAMAATLRQVDVVLNNSQSEGLPNALLEADTLGVPMLVRDIPGNAAIVEAGVNGLLYDDATSFVRQASALITDSTLRRRLARPDPARYAPATETRALVALYEEIVSAEIKAL
ncbi:MAG: GPMC system family 4 glycosyltransferase [Desulfuromonadales bacterium]|nr:GPMC system family 4 glycosyltransferase [Desulfuromonadales bacterium]